MSDPFIPTGREIDEGVSGPGLERDHDESRGLLKRLFRRGPKHAGKNLTQVELKLPEAVATKRPGIRAREPEATKGAAPGPTSPEPSSEGPETLNRPSTKDSTKSRPLTEAAATRVKRVARGESRPQSVAPSIDFVASIIALSRAPDGDPARVCKNYLTSGNAEADDAELIGWWIACEGASLPSLPKRLEQHVTADLEDVVTQILSEPSPDGALQHYQHKCATWDRFDEATKALARKSRSYSSLTPLLDAVRNEDADAAQNYVDYDSAAWHECKLEISNAIASLENIRNIGTRPSMSKLPRATSSLPLLDRSVLSCLCTPSSLAPLTAACVEVLTEAPLTHDQADLKALATHLAKSTGNARRR